MARGVAFIRCTEDHGAGCAMVGTLGLTLAVRGSVSGPLVDAWRYRPAVPTACRNFAGF